MGVHRAARGGGIVLHVGVRVKLGKKFLDARGPEGEHPGLVTIVAGAPVAFVEDARHGKLGDFLAVAKNTELGLAGEHFAAADQGGLAGLVGQAIVFDNFFGRYGQVVVGSFLFGHGIPDR